MSIVRMLEYLFCNNLTTMNHKIHLYIGFINISPRTGGSMSNLLPSVSLTHSRWYSNSIQWALQSITMDQTDMAGEHYFKSQNLWNCDILPSVPKTNLFHGSQHHSVLKLWLCRHTFFTINSWYAETQLKWCNQYNLIT